MAFCERTARVWVELNYMVGDGLHSGLNVVDPSGSINFALENCHRGINFGIIHILHVVCRTKDGQIYGTPPVCDTIEYWGLLNRE